MSTDQLATLTLRTAITTDLYALVQELAEDADDLDPTLIALCDRAEEWLNTSNDAQDGPALRRLARDAHKIGLMTGLAHGAASERRAIANERTEPGGPVLDAESTHVLDDYDGTPAVTFTFGNQEKTISPEEARALAETLTQAAIDAENAPERDDHDRAAATFRGQFG